LLRICYSVGGVSKSDFELLCQDGSRRPVDEYQSCYWDVVPTHAIVTTSAKSAELRKNYQRFLRVSAYLRRLWLVIVNWGENDYVV